MFAQTPSSAEVPSLGIPAAADLYLAHAIHPDREIAREVELVMHGEIKLRGWTPFTAEETIRTDRDLVWKAETKLFGLPVKARDESVRGYGHTEAKIFGWLPVTCAWGADVSRSCIGRMAAESIWNPSILLGKNVHWIEAGPRTAKFKISLFGHDTEIEMALNAEGRVEEIRFQRWGNPGGLPYDWYTFGGYVEEEKTFDGFTIPSKVRMGWHFATDRFNSEGEFFRAEIDRATYR